MSASLLPNAELQFCDSNGSPLAGGKVYYYIPNTSTLKSTYQDAAQTILNTNPIVLDAAGRAIVWGSGAYRQVVYDQFGNLIWDQVTQDANAGLIGNMTDKRYVAGTDFTPGTTTQLTLPSAPGTLTNLWVFFDAAYQADDQMSVVGTTLTFNSPIPVGVQEVNVKIGSTIPLGTVGNGTVTDASVASGTKLYNRINDFIDVKDPQFGAKGNGVADDTAAIQAAISYASSTGGGTVYIPHGTYNITSTLMLAQGVSLIGAGTGRLYDDTSNVYVTTIRWNTAAVGGLMVDAGNLWHGTLQGIHFDGGAKATGILQLRGAQSSTFRDLLVRRTNNSIVGFGISLDMTGQTDNQYPTQFPSCSSNIFDSVMVMEMQYRAMTLTGVITGGVNASQITENTWINCQFRSYCIDAGAVVAFVQCCDTNTFYGGMIQCDSTTTGTALVLNYSTDPGVFGNNFYGTAINGPVSGFGIDARNNAGPNSFFGCYMSSQGTPVILNAVGNPGIVKLYGPNWGSAGNVGYLNPSQVTYGTSPWTYTNTNPYQIELQMWGGTVSSVVISRNGWNAGVGGITSNLMSFILEPRDSITITASAAPMLQIIPH